MNAAYKLFHEGTLALARAEQQGIRIDIDGCNRKKKFLSRKINYLLRKFEETELAKVWRSVYGTGMNVDSNAQLSEVLYNHLGVTPPKLTNSGRGSTDEDALSKIDMPGVKLILDIRKLKKIRDTYLDQFLREVSSDGYVHPFFNLHTVRTYRSSSDSPNFQNIPKRDKDAMKICRKILFPRQGHQLLEVDFSALEVCVAACYHKDPNMMKYLHDPESDMHGDVAYKIFMLDDYDELIRKVGAVKKIKEFKLLRNAAKNGFVFPQFYGDYYKNNAYSICEWVKLPTDKKWKAGLGVKLPDGKSISEHFISKNIKDFDSLVEHLRKIEDEFWGKDFKVYAQWKEKQWQSYLKNGYVDMFTGFRCSGIMRKNETINYPVQGAAFHCLLWTFIQTDKVMREEGWDTKLVGQIHDSMVIDVNPDELEHVVETVHRIATVELPRTWDWIIVPLNVEFELAPVDGSWADKKDYERRGE